MFLVVGLGNPGGRYERTRHNVGWWVVDRLVDRWRARPGDRTRLGRTWHAEFAGRDVVLMKPLTYMNLSGDAVAEWMSGRESGPGDLLVIADDVYLPVGSLRLRASGSAGGHRGLESVEGALGTRDYARLRIGVGAAEGAALREHVLDEPGDGERELLERAAVEAADAVECWLDEGLLAAMNRFNRKVRKEDSES